MRVRDKTWEWGDSKINTFLWCVHSPKIPQLKEFHHVWCRLMGAHQDFLVLHLPPCIPVMGWPNRGGVEPTQPLSSLPASDVKGRDGNVKRNWYAFSTSHGLATTLPKGLPAITIPEHQEWSRLRTEPVSRSSHSGEARTDLLHVQNHQGLFSCRKDADLCCYQGLHDCPFRLKRDLGVGKTPHLGHRVIVGGALKNLVK